MDQQKPLILIVDDSSTNIDVLVHTLKDHYRLGVEKNGTNALKFSEKRLPDLVLLDIVMPDIDGYEVCTRLKASAQTKDVPVIFISGKTTTGDKTKGFDVGAVDYIVKPFETAEVLTRIRTHLSLVRMRAELNNQNVVLAEKVKKQTHHLEEMLEASLYALSSTVDSRDPYTAGHQHRVARLAGAIAKKMRLNNERIRGLHFAGVLHDLGKIRIPGQILSWPGKLLDAEFSLIQIHPQTGYDILKEIPSPWPLAEIAWQHHEKLDGSGYPQGLQEDEILLESKILTVADVTEAMGSHRPYRPALGMDVALAEIEKNKGRFYDPEVVEACVRLIKEEGFEFD